MSKPKVVVAKGDDVKIRIVWNRKEVLYDG